MNGIRLAVKHQGEDEPVQQQEWYGQLAAEATLDAGDSFKVSFYLDSNGDYTMITKAFDVERRSTGKWK